MSFYFYPAFYKKCFVLIMVIPECVLVWFDDMSLVLDIDVVQNVLRGVALV